MPLWLTHTSQNGYISCRDEREQVAIFLYILCLKDKRGLTHVGGNLTSSLHHASGAVAVPKHLHMEMLCTFYFMTGYACTISKQ